MKKIVLFLLSLAAATVFAQDAKQTLLQTVQKLGIAQELENAPDGVTMRLFSDGRFQIFAVGTGTYDFDDVDDVLDAQNEATAKAKANLAKFMNESLSTDEYELPGSWKGKIYFVKCKTPPHMIQAEVFYGFIACFLGGKRGRILPATLPWSLFFIRFVFTLCFP
jgi:hypothetical protein